MTSMPRYGRSLSATRMVQRGIALEHRDLPIAPGHLEVERPVLEEVPDGRQKDGSVLAMDAEDGMQWAFQEIAEVARLEVPAHGESVRMSPRAPTVRGGRRRP